ncbi:MAG: hypothetical protein WCB04_02225, partial [Mycobacteriales bacterium]
MTSPRYFARVGVRIRNAILRKNRIAPAVAMMVLAGAVLAPPASAAPPMPPAMIDIGTLPGGTTSGAYAVNNSGQVAGSANTASGQTHAIFWSRGKMT